MYAQDRNGAYSLRKVDPANLLQGMDYANAPFEKGKFTQIKRNMAVIGRLLDPAQNAGTIRGAGAAQQIIKSAAPRFDDATLAQHDARQKQPLMLFSGALAATEAPSLLQQAKSSGSYALMNKMHGGNMTDGLKKIIDPIRAKFGL